MIKEFIICNKIVRIYTNILKKISVPVVILNCFDDEGETVFNNCISYNCRDFILVTINIKDWNSDMSPWFCKSIYKNDNDFVGNADNYLYELEKNIIPKVKEYIEKICKVNISYFAITGYSLGGLFALYSCYKSSLFTRFASVSGSLWYPNIVKYVHENKLKSNIKIGYFSLGNKESVTKNEIVKNVLNNTIDIVNFLNNSINCHFEENEGNHFQNANYRMAKGIKYIIDD